MKIYNEEFYRITVKIKFKFNLTKGPQNLDTKDRESIIIRIFSVVHNHILRVWEGE